MTRSNTSKLKPFDSEIERTLHKLHNLLGEKLSPKNQLVKMEETLALVGAVGVGVVGVENLRRTLMEYAQPSIDGTTSYIRKLAVQANNFELKPSYVQMIQNSVQFHGLPYEDLNLHIAYFVDICDMFRVNGVLDDAIRLRFFLSL